MAGEFQLYPRACAHAFAGFAHSGLPGEDFRAAVQVEAMTAAVNSGLQRAVLGKTAGIVLSPQTVARLGAARHKRADRLAGEHFLRRHIVSPASTLIA